MGDHFCAVTGGRYFESRQEFRDAIIEMCDNISDDEWDYEDETQSSDEGDAEDAQRSDDDVKRLPHLSKAVWKGLLYSQEDVDSSWNFVLLCPYMREGGTTLLDNYECLRPEDIMESNIIEVFDVIPEPNPHDGIYQCEYHEFDLWLGSAHIIMYTPYLIVKQASPRLKPHLIYHLISYPDYSSFPIDYGPPARLDSQFADWVAISDFDDRRGDWECMLTEKGKTDDEILDEVWRGRGNMWVFVRPDRFPIAETLAAKPLLVVSGYNSVEMDTHGPLTFDALPLDILILICQLLPVKSAHVVLCTNRHLRSQILPYTNMMAHKQIIAYEPHLLPAGPFNLDDGKHGKEEVDWWNAQWAKGGIPKEELTVRIPWFLYRIECSKSLSMWNRRRIWGIAKQYESLAVKRGLLV